MRYTHNIHTIKSKKSFGGHCLNEEKNQNRRIKYYGWEIGKILTRIIIIQLHL